MFLLFLSLKVIISEVRVAMIPTVVLVSPLSALKGAMKFYYVIEDILRLMNNFFKKTLIESFLMCYRILFKFRIKNFKIRNVNFINIFEKL